MKSIAALFSFFIINNMHVLMSPRKKLKEKVGLYLEKQKMIKVINSGSVKFCDFKRVGAAQGKLVLLSLKMNERPPQERFLPEVTCVQIATLYEEGYTQVQLALRFNVNQSTISRVLRRFNVTGNHSRRPGQGRRRVTDARQDRFLRLSALRQRFVTSTTLQNEFLLRYNFNISQNTVRRRLAEDTICPYTAARGPLLTREHRRQRLQFAREHLNWAVDDWARVLFSDESRFCLFSDDRRNRVYRRPGERYAQCNFMQTVSYGGGSVMVWGGINLEARTDLVVVNRGRLTAIRYIEEILEQHVMPFAPFVGDDFMLMHDNARPHIARIVQQYLQEVDIRSMVWPPRSPDLNPIEHLWDTMGRRVRSLNNPAMTHEALSERLIEIWAEIDQDEIRSLIASMPRRCEAVIRARGGNTRY